MLEKPRLQTLYKDTIAPNLKKKHGLKSIHAVARLKKITINMGVGDAVNDKHALDKAMADLQLITGQKPIQTKARKSIAGFKIRAGWPIGCKVTLRKARMYEFLDRLISIYLPRVRDFRGLSKRAFDGGGNYSMGLREQTVCPEIELDKVDKTRGFDITITTNAKDDASAHELLKLFGFPIKE